ncbi:MAG: FkbM family methyltransferase [Nitrospirota bacterium]
MSLIRNTYEKIERLLSGSDYKVISNRLGTFCIPYNTPKCPICKTIRKGEIHSEYVLNMLKPYIRGGSTIVDVGANLGVLSVEFARQLGSAGGGTVVAIEANQIIYDLLKRNLSSNCPPDVKMMPMYCACTDVDGGVMEFPEPDIQKGKTFTSYGSFGLKTGPSTGKSFTVEAVTIDSLKLSDVSCIKIDVEGFDLKAMMGARETMLREKCAVVFEYGAGSNEENTFDEYEAFIKEINYKIVGQEKTDYLIVPQ